MNYEKRASFSHPELDFPTVLTALTIILPEKLKPPVDYHLLQFWTISCFFKIAEIDVTERTGTLIGMNGETCGRILLDGFENLSLLELETPSYEIILLSECQKLWPSSDHVLYGHEGWDFKSCC